jgi:hypothetical protein
MYCVLLPVPPEQAPGQLYLPPLQSGEQPQPGQISHCYQVQEEINQSWALINVFILFYSDTYFSYTVHSGTVVS